MSNYQVAVYYFPNYHADRRNEEWHGKGWTEWELVKAAKPRFDGHQQPKVPLWGYEDESKPEAMQRKIDAAADHGVSAFIFDWSVQGRPVSSKCFGEGFPWCAQQQAAEVRTHVGKP